MKALDTMLKDKTGRSVVFFSFFSQQSNRGLLIPSTFFLPDSWKSLLEYVFANIS